MKSKEVIEDTLCHFTGSENYYRHQFGLIYTDGVKEMATLCEAYWLLDAIGSYQPKCMRDPMLVDFQFWTLRRVEGKKFVLLCERDTNDIAITQNIPYSDFPLDEIKLYVGPDKIICLASEY